MKVIAHGQKLSHSTTVSTILKARERIRQAVKGSAPIQSTIITKQRCPRNGEIAVHLDARSDPKKPTPLTSFYCADEG